MDPMYGPGMEAEPVSRHHLYDPVVAAADQEHPLPAFLLKHMNQQQPQQDPAQPNDRHFFPATRLQSGIAPSSPLDNNDENEDEGDELLRHRADGGDDGSYGDVSGQQQFGSRSQAGDEEQDQQDSRRHTAITPDMYMPAPVSSPPIRDMDTDASRRVDQHEWLDMGAYSGKQGSFGWYADFPVGGIGTQHG